MLNVNIEICLVKYVYTISKYTIKCDRYLQKYINTFPVNFK